MRFTSVFILLLLGGLCSPVRAQLRFSASPKVGIELDYANPKQYEIGGITVSGAKFLDTEALLSITGLKVGDQITVPGEELSKAIHKLWDQGILGDVQVTVTDIRGNYIFLDFALTERPRLARFAFSGIKKSNADELREKIRLIRGKVVTESLISNTRNTVRKYYLDKGYMNVKVDIKQEKDSALANSVVLRINIDKKDKVKIGEIAIAGNEAISEKKLQRKMKNTKEKRWYKLLTSSKFLRTNYEKDKAAIVEYYNSEGYRDAAIVSDSVYTGPDGRLRINLTVDEGRKYFFRNITWTGNYLYSDKYLGSILGIKKGDVYSKEVLDKKLSFNPIGTDVTSLYMDDGYLFFSIDPAEVLVEGDSIDLEMRIYEGAQARVNAVNVSGNTKTSDHVILRELRTVPGQKFSRADLIRSQRELSQLGYFDPEQIGINPVPNQTDGTVDINYTVVEKPNDQITLSGGWGGRLGFVGTLGLAFNNFSIRKIGQFREWQPLPAGDGQRLAFNIQANGRRYQSYSLSFTEPWLGGRKPNSFTVSVSHSVQNLFSSLTDNKRTGWLHISGATVSLGRRLRWPDDYFVLSNSLSYYLYNFNNYQLFPGLTKGYSNSISFITSISRNSVDNPTYPRRGAALSLSANLTPPYSLLPGTRDLDPIRFVEFQKYMFDSQWYLRLAGNLVLNTRAHFGFIGSYSKDRETGPFERFILGGSGLGGAGNFFFGLDYIGLRGYNDNSLNANGQNGVAYNKFVTELRYPVSLNPMATVFVLGFAEAGNNVSSFKEYNPYNLYRSAGVGTRIFMPAFGLIGFDWGYGFDDLFDGGGKRLNGSQFHFIIGQQIR